MNSEFKINNEDTIFMKRNRLSMNQNYLTKEFLNKIIKIYKYFQKKHQVLII